MNHYVIVSAVRIQSWLVRTPELRLLRGASRAMSDISADSTVTQWLTGSDIPADVRSGQPRVCPEAGDVDGVIVVTVQDDVACRPVRDFLIAKVRQQLPGAEWIAWIGSADTYLAARRSSLDDVASAYLVSPSMAEVPFALPCDGCRAEPASELKRAADMSRPAVYLGRDCIARLDHGHSHHRDMYNDRLNLPGESPRDFESLAAVLGNPAVAADSYGGKRNHLAVIMADGNGVGALFEAIDTQGTDEIRERVAHAIDEATGLAVKRAVDAIAGMSPATTPAIVHFVGGDDVLVSVPAPLAWTFVTELIKGLGILDHLAVEAAPSEKWLHELAARTSLGVGVVFAHASHPIADSQDVAHRAMAQAKTAVAGRQSVVSWVDLTAEDHVPPGRFLTGDDLIALRGSPSTKPANPLLSLPPAARSVLAGLQMDGMRALRGAQTLRLKRTIEASDSDELARLSTQARQAADRMHFQALRNDRIDVSDWLKTDVLQPLDGLLGGSPADLAGALSIFTRIGDWLNLARWWPGATTQSPLPVASNGLNGATR